MSKPADANCPSAKFAVVRLKPGDNLLGLFQLLIQNGFGEISFVNSLSETIFPILADGKRSGSPSGKDTRQMEKVQQTVREEKEKMKPMESAQSKMENAPMPAQNKMENVHGLKFVTPPAVDPYQIFQRHETGQNQSMAQQKSNAESPVKSQAPMVSQTSALTANTFPNFPAVHPSLFGLPTLRGATAMPALPEAATPPYSLANFLIPRNLSTGTTTMAPIGPPGKFQHYPPTLLAFTGQRSVAPSVSTPITLPLRPTSPVGLLLASHRHQQNSFYQQHPPQQQQPSAVSGQHQQQQQQQLSIIPGQQQQQQQHSAKLPTNQSPTPSSRSGSSSSTGSAHMACVQLPPGCATTHLRQRGQRSYAEDPSLYVSCRLCKNKIMGSRISNLTNHVRRHSSMKQFQCCYCDYTHNEMAKVRLHMLHNHKDKDSQPIDNLSPEMQASWDLLMKECFPDHCSNQQQQYQQNQPANTTRSGLMSGYSKLPAQISSVTQQHSTIGFPPGKNLPVVQMNISPVDSVSPMHQRPNLSPISPASSSSNQQQNSPVNQQQNLSCSISPINQQQNLSCSISPINQQQNLSCSISPINQQQNLSCSISPINQQQNLSCSISPINQQQTLVYRCVECGMYVNWKSRGRHIRKFHLQCLLPFVCSMCGYDHSEHSKVKLHICLKHDDDPTAQVVTRDVASYAERLVNVYFPSDSSVRISAAPDQINPVKSVENIVKPLEPVDQQSEMSQLVKEESSVMDNEKQCEVGNDRSTCVVCDQKIEKMGLARHVKRHLKAVSIGLLCPVCGRYQTNSRIRMIRHLGSKHNITTESQIKPVIFRRILTSTSLASMGTGLVKFASDRCFPSTTKVWRTLQCGKAVLKRYRGKGKKPVASIRKGKRGRVVKGEGQKGKEIRQGLVSVEPSEAIMAQEPKVNPDPRPHVASNSFHSPSDLMRMCPLCGQWVHRDQLAGHFQSHVPPTAGPIYHCKLCDFLAADPMLVNAHFVREHQKLMHQRSEVQHAALLMACASLCRNSNTTAAVDG